MFQRVTVGDGRFLSWRLSPEMQLELLNYDEESQAKVFALLAENAKLFVKIMSAALVPRLKPSLGRTLAAQETVRRRLEELLSELTEAPDDSAQRTQPTTTRATLTHL